MCLGLSVALEAGSSTHLLALWQQGCKAVMSSALSAACPASVGGSWLCGTCG